VGASKHDVLFRFPPHAPVETADAMLAATLIPAMRLRKAFKLTEPVCGTLLSATNKIQDIMTCWYPDLDRVFPDVASRSAEVHTKNRGVGCFFSGGVDSFYSVLKHIDTISHLIFVHGFDLPLTNPALRAKVSQQLQRAAAMLGKHLIEVETNLRNFADRWAPWGTHYHGAALATVAHLLSPILHKVIIPSSFSYEMLDPWGSHPLLDPLWSTERLELVHDGCEVNRISKVAAIAHNDVVRESLRVCYQSLSGAYNCCRCPKCLNTMLALDAVGELGKVKTFPGGLSEDSLRQARIASKAGYLFSHEILTYLTKGAQTRQYEQKIKHMMHDFELRQQAVAIDPGILAAVRSPLWRDIRDDVLHGIWLSHQRCWLIQGVFLEMGRYFWRKILRGVEKLR